MPKICADPCLSTVPALVFHLKQSRWALPKSLLGKNRCKVPFYFNGHSLCQSLSCQERHSFFCLFVWRETWLGGSTFAEEKTYVHRVPKGIHVCVMKVSFLRRLLESPRHQGRVRRILRHCRPRRPRDRCRHQGRSSAPPVLARAAFLWCSVDASRSERKPCMTSFMYLTKFRHFWSRPGWPPREVFTNQVWSDTWAEESAEAKESAASGVKNLTSLDMY